MDVGGVEREAVGVTAPMVGGGAGTWCSFRGGEGEGVRKVRRGSGRGKELRGRGREVP